jgi:hypothetical protein
MDHEAEVGVEKSRDVACRELVPVMYRGKTLYFIASPMIEQTENTPTNADTTSAAGAMPAMRKPPARETD